VIAVMAIKYRKKIVRNMGGTLLKSKIILWKLNDSLLVYRELACLPAGRFIGAGLGQIPASCSPIPNPWLPFL